ncbi:serine hydrolase family protein [Candidatus Pacearchaeota archaeon]|nr:serine hydrolase family protein [Candidatus Pacearchaeota archaeon]
MKKVYIVHRWDSSPESDWYPWLKKELIKRKFEADILRMPDPGFPKIDVWVNYLNENVKNIDKDTILIGHSVGCQTILRFMEKLPFDVKVGKVVLVAPWLELRGIEEEGPEVVKIAKPWLKKKINWNKINEHCEKFVCIFSTNDPYVPLSNVEKLYNKLGNKTIILKNKGHFTKEEGVKELPEILEWIG